MEEAPTNTAMKRVLLIISCILLTLGNCGGPILMRLYFINGGQRVWLSSCLQSAGWPLILLPLTIFYFRRRHHTTATFFSIKPPLFATAAAIGVLTGLDSYLYAYGLARIPVSTSSLIIATQLVFTAGFAFLLVKQKFSAYSINAVVLLTIGAAVLVLHTSGDRPGHESDKEYYIGFFTTIGAAALVGLIFPLLELTYKKAKQEVTYSVVMEIQMVMSLFATVFCIVGMLVNNDFRVISREAREFELGKARYYVVLVWSAIIWQFSFLGFVGIIFSSSSLVCGIMTAVLVPVTEILAVILFHEKFQPEKGISLALSLWGFVSYFYGDLKQSKKNNQTLKTEMHQISAP